jgi:hypothetical protein
MMADELFLLLEGARVTAQSMGPKGLGDRLVRFDSGIRQRAAALVTASLLGSS